MKLANLADKLISVNIFCQLKSMCLGKSVSMIIYWVVFSFDLLVQLLIYWLMPAA